MDKMVWNNDPLFVSPVLPPIVGLVFTGLEIGFESVKAPLPKVDTVLPPVIKTRPPAWFPGFWGMVTKLPCEPVEELLPRLSVAPDVMAMDPEELPPVLPEFALPPAQSTKVLAKRPK
jgi:hypothetical protein